VPKKAAATVTSTAKAQERPRSASTAKKSKED
jgi:hypothetical protein